ncbi:MAG: ribosome assembly factor SBDS [Candidatus Aenigmarchaeota archaeon]|nr:ribosome assembly factor SBDS [Candidatus Aenigmarchaeota archaeon]
MTISIEKAVVARLNYAQQKFEILVDPNKAMDFKNGRMIPMEEMLAYPIIYKDTKAAEAVPEKDLQKAFGTTDAMKIAVKILKEGEIQITTEQRREMTEQKRHLIATLISKRGINPQTNTPHPEQRVLNAMQQAGVNIDPFADAELQMDKVVKAVKPILPLKFQNVTLQIKIPPQFAGKAFSVIKSAGKVTSEQWLNDGSLQASVEMLAGVMDEFSQKIANMTHGSFESKVIKREDL